MRITLKGVAGLALALAASMVVPISALALPWSDVSGTIRSIDVSTRQVDLDNGRTYYVQRGINLAKFKAGDRVTLRTEDEHGKQTVTKLKEGENSIAPVTKQRSRRGRFP
jgi:Cu/Ag efflux protein CusF